jgi:hypothetical protein
MNKSTGSKKLSLKTETLVRLDDTDLEYVQGGTSPAFSIAIRVSARACVPAGEWALRTAQGPAAGTGFLTVVKNRPQGNPANPPSVVGATA